MFWIGKRIFNKRIEEDHFVAFADFCTVTIACLSVKPGNIRKFNSFQ